MIAFCHRSRQAARRVIRNRLQYSVASTLAAYRSFQNPGIQCTRPSLLVTVLGAYQYVMLILTNFVHVMYLTESSSSKIIFA